MEDLIYSSITFVPPAYQWSLSLVQRMRQRDSAPNRFITPEVSASKNNLHCREEYARLANKTQEDNIFFIFAKAEDEFDVD